MSTRPDVTGEPRPSSFRPNCAELRNTKRTKDESEIGTEKENRKMQRQREGGQRAGWYEHGKPSKRPIPGILVRARRHVCNMQAEKRNMQERKDTSRYERASEKKAT